MYHSITRPWDQISKRYQEWMGKDLGVEAISRLVDKIISSRYANGIHAWTSMLDLCIVQQEVTYVNEGPYLRIRPLSDGQLKFQYIDTYIVERQWSRTVPGLEAFERLEKFFDQLHWFSKE
jgi:hypothetical protein